MNANQKEVFDVARNPPNMGQTNDQNRNKAMISGTPYRPSANHPGTPENTIHLEEQKKIISHIDNVNNNIQNLANYINDIVKKLADSNKIFINEKMMEFESGLRKDISNDSRKEFSKLAEDLKKEILNLNKSFAEEISKIIYQQLANSLKNTPKKSDLEEVQNTIKSQNEELWEKLISYHEKQNDRYNTIQKNIEILTDIAFQAFQGHDRNQSKIDPQLRQEITPIYEGLSELKKHHSSTFLNKICLYLSDLLDQDSLTKKPEISFQTFPDFLKDAIEKHLTESNPTIDFCFQKVESQYINYVASEIIAFYRQKLSHSDDSINSRNSIQKRLIDDYKIINILDVIDEISLGIGDEQAGLRDKILLFLEWEKVNVQINVDKVDVGCHNVVDKKLVENPELQGVIIKIYKNGYKTKSGDWIRKPAVISGTTI